jgi:hypothetical protein
MIVFISIFGFANKYPARDGFVLFFYDDNFWVLRDIKSYLENYEFKIHSKFAIIKSMHHTSPKFLNKKVNIL